MKKKFSFLSKKIITFIIEKLDKLLSLFFLLIGIAIIALSYLSGLGQFGLGLAFLSAPLIYLVIKKKSVLNLSTDSFKITWMNSNLSSLLNICFWIIFTISLIILNKTLYFRPESYFIVISIGFTILIVQIFYLKFSFLNFSSFFIKLLFLSISFRASRFFTFPVIPGNDTHQHLLLGKYILVTGSVAPFELAERYAYTPLWHIYDAIYLLIFNLNMGLTLFFLATAIISIITFLAYVIGKKLFDFRVGLVAAVFVNIGDMIFVSTLTNINTSILVLVYFLLLIVFLLYTKNSTKKIFSVIAFSTIIALFWTHQLSVFAIYIILCGIFIFYCIFTSKYFHKTFAPLVSYEIRENNNYLTIGFMIFTSIYMIFFWSYLGTESNESGFLGQMVPRLERTFVSMLSEYSSSAKLPTTVYEKMFSNFDFINSLFYNLGYGLLFCLALIGVLLVLKHFFNLDRGALVFATGILFIVIYPGTYIGLNQLFIPHRFLPIFQLIFIIFSAFSLIVLYNIHRARISRVFLIFFIFIMVFFLVTAPYINRNDLVYSKNMELRTEITLSELTGIYWGQHYATDSYITVDPLISQRSLSTVEFLPLKSDNIAYYQDYDESILRYFRLYIENNPEMQVSGTYGKMRIVDYSGYILKIESQKNLLFNNYQVKIYD